MLYKYHEPVMQCLYYYFNENIAIMQLNVTLYSTPTI